MTPVLRTAAAVFILDILTKAAALHWLTASRPIPVLPGFFNLSLVFNRGAAFGMFPGGANVFLILAVLTVLALLIFAARNPNAPVAVKIALGAIIGGAAGNLLDRLRLGCVVDFLDFYIAHWHWPAFNVADASLCVGAGLLVLCTLRRSPPS